MAQEVKSKVYNIKDFTGGWNPRMTPLVLEEGMQGPMQSPDLLNCDFNYPTGIEKRLGKKHNGNPINTNSLLYSQANKSTAVDPIPQTTGNLANPSAYVANFSTMSSGADKSISQVIVNFEIVKNNSSARGCVVGLEIWDDN